MRSNLHAIRATVRQGQVMPDDGIGLQGLHFIESLQQANRHVAALSQGELLSDTDSWSTVELMYVHLVSHPENLW